jgi:DNA-binding response OmpR family regulator
MAVLIADNDEAVSGLLSEVLAQQGVRPRQAFDGDEARRMARAPDVTVLVCDLDMPGASGLEVLESLRDLDRPPAAIVVSGYLDAGIEARLRALDFVHEVMRKPFDLLGFAAVVHRLLGAARQDRDEAADGGEATGC